MCAVLLLVLMVAPSAALGVLLRCEVSARPGGQVRYQLRPGPGQDSLLQNCSPRGWEDAQKTVLTLDSDLDHDRVQNLSVWTLDLKECLDYAHFTAQCSVFVEAFCRTNCSAMSEMSQARPPDAAPPHESCGHLCVALVSAAAVVLGLLVIGLVLWKVLLPVFRRQQYRPAPAQAPARAPAQAPAQAPELHPGPFPV